MGTRTPNLLITNQRLCQLSYDGILREACEISSHACPFGSLTVYHASTGPFRCTPRHARQDAPHVCLVRIWWTLWDSNPRPIAYEATALTDCAKCP